MFNFIKEHKLCQRVIAIVLIAAFVILQIPSFITEATDTASYNVSDYKGDKAQAEWTYPTQTGKVFAGWYTDTTYSTVYTETTGQAVAKFVDEKVLTVKVQLKKDTALDSQETNIRFLTAIDSLRYDMVEFDVKVPESDRTFTLQETKAYSSVLVDDDTTYPYNAAQVFETDAAKYFVVHSITNIPNDAFGHTFTATPYWYTLDGTKVAGTTRNLTVDGEVLFPFAEKVTIGGNEFTSALDKWDLSEVQNNTLKGSSTLGSNEQPVYFKETGNTALLRTEVEYTGITKENISEHDEYIRPRLIVTNGTDATYYNLLIQSNDIFVNGKEKTNVLDTVVGATYHVLRPSQNMDALTIQFDVALQDNNFYVYVNGVLVATIAKSEVVPGATTSTSLAFGLDISLPGQRGTASYEFRNIEFTTDAAAVTKFLNSKNLFSKSVTINGKTWTSSYDKWDTSALEDGILKGSLAKGSNGQPMYFTQTGNEALLQTEVAYTTDFSGGEDTTNYQTLIKPRLIVTDGTNDVTNYYYIMLHSNDVRLTGWDKDFIENVLEDHVLRQSYGHLAIQLDIALIDGYFYVYVDDVFVTSIEISRVVPNATAETQLAFGLDVHLDDATRAADYEFRNIQFTTVSEKVRTYFMQGNIFAETVTINGKTWTSAYDKWDTSALEEGILKGSLAKGSNGQPMYFTQTGNEALLQTEVAYTTDFSGGEDTTNYQTLIKPRLIVTDGTNDVTNYYYIMLHSNDVRLTGWDKDFIENVLEDHVLRQSYGHLAIQLDIALIDGYFYVYVDDVFVTSIEISRVVPNATAETQLAFGLDVHLDDATRAADYEFRNIQFTTLSGCVNSFLAEKKAELLQHRTGSANTKKDLIQAQYNENGEIGVLFLGDSFFDTYFWSDFDTTFAGKNMLTAGISATTTYEWDEWVDELVYPYAPENIVIHLGTNDIWDCHDDGKKAGNNVVELLTDLSQNLPNTKIYWYSIEYRRNYAKGYTLDATYAMVREANAIVKAYCDTTDQVTYLDSMSFSTLNNDGMTYNDAFFRDGVHPTLENYQYYVDLLGTHMNFNEYNISSTLFAETVTINGTNLQSAYSKWDTSAIADNVLKGSYDLGSYRQPIYFAQTGNEALLQTEVAYTTDFTNGFDETTYQGTLMPRLMVSDGTNTSSYIMLSSNDVIYTGWTVMDDLLPYHVLRQNYGHLTIQFDVVLKNGYFYLYVDDVFVTSIEVSKIVPDATKDTKLAFGIDMLTDKASDYEFRNIQFTTRSSSVDSFFIGKKLVGKQLSILGDSLSTYEGVSNSGTPNTTTAGYNAWYNGDWQNVLNDWNETYWGQIITKYGMHLLVNNSCGGNQLTTDSGTRVTADAGYKRAAQLAANTGDLAGTNPDVIFLHMGTNDYIFNVSIDTFKEAYVTTLDTMISTYPNVEIYCFTLTPSSYNTDWNALNSYNTAIREVVATYADQGVVLVDVASESNITTANYNDYTFDGTHYNALGITELVQVLEKALVQ